MEQPKELQDTREYKEWRQAWEDWHAACQQIKEKRLAFNAKKATYWRREVLRLAYELRTIDSVDVEELLGLKREHGGRILSRLCKEGHLIKKGRNPKAGKSMTYTIKELG